MKKILTDILPRRLLLICAAVVLSACSGGGGSNNEAVRPPSSDIEPPASDPTRPPMYFAWMSPEIQEAWNQGALGQNIWITSVDDFSSDEKLSGKLGVNREEMRHGEWVLLQGGMIAPSAMLTAHDFSSGMSVLLNGEQLDVLNLSYGAFAPDGFHAINWSPQERSIITAARDGTAVVVKSAGNDTVAVGDVNSSGGLDYLNRDLIGASSAIFVGALQKNGTNSDQADIASYSNFSGSNEVVQNQFVTVGVDGRLTGLHGTSFAAPIVSGYAAVIGSKFTTATPTQVTSQLLNTARRDTIRNYDVEIHGRGEASISRALAPLSIN